ncbi:MAG: hypothetical protein WKF58_13530 [Ilumatobacteraceae bacterium]
MAVPRVVRIGVESEARGPLLARPHLILAEQLGDVMVLGASEVPHEPSDRVRSGRDLGDELFGTQVIDGTVDVLVGATEQLDEHIAVIHRSTCST